MATAKKAPGKVSSSRAIQPWEEQMKLAAKRQAQQEKPVGGMKAISTRGGILSIDKKPVKGNELLAVVVGAVHAFEWYADLEYDPEKPLTPPCYALGDNSFDDPEDHMAPHKEAEDKQTDGLCKNCPQNEWGSATKGRGKACKNVRKLALFTADALESPEALLEAEMRTLKVPVMSVANWAKYVRDKCTEELDRPYWGTVVRIFPTPDPKSQFRINFEFEELVTFDGKLYEAMQKRLAEAEKALTQPYPKFSDEPAAETKAVKGQRKVIPVKAAPPAKKAAARR